MKEQLRPHIITATDRRRPIILLLCILSAFCIFFDQWILPNSDVVIDAERKEYCDYLAKRPFQEPDYERVINPRVFRPEDRRSILLRNASVINGDGRDYTGLAINIFIKDGIIRERGIEVKGEEGQQIIDLNGAYLTPGIIDMHSHMGVDSLPELKGTDDTNEMSLGSTTPFVRTLDAINPSDPMIPIIASGGVTTSLILPGSANVIGGEAFVVKHRIPSSLSVNEMLLQYGMTEKPQRWMKMACGENPKRVYAKKGGPGTRMGEAYVFRKLLQKASAVLKRQHGYCAGVYAQDEVEIDDELLVSLLNGDVNLNIHCYETMDMETMIRHAKEFNFTISAFHHALEAHRIPTILKESFPDITIATFADVWGYKKEAYRASVYAGKILTEAGINVAYKSDHPVTNAKYVLYEAQIAHHYGLPADLAIKSIIGVPAKSLGLDHRIGDIQAGYDADLAIWSQHPLNLGAYPTQVFIDGIAQLPETNSRNYEMNRKSEASRPTRQIEIKLSESTLITGIKHDFLTRSSDALTSQIYISNGLVKCMALDCSQIVNNAAEKEHNLIELQNGYLLPGLVGMSQGLGLLDIDAEFSTVDGIVADGWASWKNSRIVNAVDGLSFGGKHLEYAHESGLFTVITPPLGYGFILGQSVAFNSASKGINENGAIRKNVTGLHISISHGSRDVAHTTVASEISNLRELLLDSNDSQTYSSVCSGDLPLVIHANNKDIISKIIKVKAEVAHICHPKIVIFGGAEADSVADELAQAKIHVILAPWRCMPTSWEQRHCNPNLPLAADTNIKILRNAGVNISLGLSGDDSPRELFWEAGWAAQTAGMTELDALDLVSTSYERVFGIEKDTSSFMVYEGSPFEFGSQQILRVSHNHPLTNTI